MSAKPLVTAASLLSRGAFVHTAQVSSIEARRGMVVTPMGPPDDDEIPAPGAASIATPLAPQPAVCIRIYYASERPDLDESVVLDALQAEFTKTDEGGERNLIRAGVYRNDRQVREKHIFHAIDRINPRAEIEVEQLAGAVASLFEPEAMPIPVVVPAQRQRTRPPAKARVAPTVPAGADPF
jgi:hypothetical protein